MAPRRMNGCQPPFTFIQVGAWIYQLITLVWFAVVAFGFLSGSDDAPIIVTSVLWSIFAAVAIGCWFWCQLADPAVVDTSCITFKQHDSHYCAVCKKVVPGIDHQLVFIDCIDSSRFCPSTNYKTACIYKLQMVKYLRRYENLFVFLFIDHFCHLAVYLASHIFGAFDVRLEIARSRTESNGCFP